MFYLENNHIFTVELTWTMTQQLHILPECHVSPHNISLKLHILPKLHVISLRFHKQKAPQVTHNVYTTLNCIMNPDTNSSEESMGQTEKVDENLVQENPSLHLKSRTQPHCIHAKETCWDQYY